MNINVSVSVIVPVYNAENYLDRCIKSILNQTYQNIELILVDDGSTDRSKEIYEKYNLYDNRLKCLYQDNGGVSSARNRGLEISKGKYILFIDSDDYIERYFIENAILDIEKENSDLYMCGHYEEVYDKKKLIKIESYHGLGRICSLDELIKEMGKTYPLMMIQSCWGKLYIKDIIDKNDIKFKSDMKIGEDQCFNHEYLININKIVFSKNTYYHYLKFNQGSLTQKFYSNIYDLNNEICNSFYSLREIVSKDAKLNIEIDCCKKMIACIHHTFKNDKYVSEDEKNTIIEKIMNNIYVKNSFENIKYFAIKDRIVLVLLKYRFKKSVKALFDLKYNI